MSILGIDEVGRGPWAGPLVIGACILPKDPAGNYPDWVAPLTDSKKLSEKKRETYAQIILEKAIATSLGWVSATEIDQLGLSKSLRLATHRAVETIRQTKAPFTEIIIDGTVNFLVGTSLEHHVTNLKKADLLIKEVSAASIIAKVARDNYMKQLAKQYPGYGFDKHVGYGTKLHEEMLAKFGPCPEHRMSFSPVAERAVRFEGLKTRPERPAEEQRTTVRCLSRSAPWDAARAQPEGASLQNERPTSKQLGDHAESIVANYLRNQGHNIIARNHKTKFYEIDIVSVRGDKIYFTEVKYRKDSYRGTPLDMVTKKKLAQMTFAAESFLKYRPDFQNLSPLLAVGLVSGDGFTLDDWLVIS